MDYKISQLRYRLSIAGVDKAEIDYLVSRVMDRAKDKMSAALEAGVSLATQEADQLKARGFMGEISVRPSYDGFEIGTDSGKTDFSTQPFPMLDRLLAGGKTAKDGSTYRVIPIGGSSSKKAEMVKDVSAGVSAADNVKTRPSLTAMANDMAAAFGMSAKQKLKPSSHSMSNSSPSFRVASSKQDKNTQWVIPARQADLTSALSSINSMMAGDISLAIDQSISELEGEINDAERNA